MFCVGFRQENYNLHRTRRSLFGLTPKRYLGRSEIIDCHVIDARNQHQLLCELQADEKSEHCNMDADCPPSFPPSPGAGTVFADNAVFH